MLRRVCVCADIYSVCPLGCYPQGRRRRHTDTAQHTHIVHVDNYSQKMSTPKLAPLRCFVHGCVCVKVNVVG